MDKGVQEYLSFMLRLWQVGGGEDSPWRASLESPLTGEKAGFADLDSLFAFLCERTGKSTDDTDPPPV